MLSKLALNFGLAIIAEKSMVFHCTGNAISGLSFNPDSIISEHDEIDEIVENEVEYKI